MISVSIDLLEKKGEILKADFKKLERDSEVGLANVVLPCLFCVIGYRNGRIDKYGRTDDVEGRTSDSWDIETMIERTDCAYGNIYLCCGQRKLGTKHERCK